MYIQGSPCCNNGLIEVANSMEDIGHSEVAHVSSLVRGIVDGPAKTLEGIGWVTHHPPVERGNVEENPVGTILYVYGREVMNTSVFLMTCVHMHQYQWECVHMYIEEHKCTCIYTPIHVHKCVCV